MQGESELLKKVHILILVLICLSGYSVTAADHDALSGISFSDPSKVIQMPDDWKKKPITHGETAGNADLVITLDGQMHNAWEQLIEKYAREHNLKIVIHRGTCGVSAGELSQKSIDIGAFCCPPGFTDRLPGLKFHTAGIAALALLIHPDNGTNNITFKQAQQIFQGDIQRWSEISDSVKKGLLIQPVARLHCKLRPGHWRLLLDNHDLFSPGLFEVGAIPDMISQVAINPASIGYEILWMARYHSDKGDVKVLNIDGYSPDNPSHVISTLYPLYRVYSFATWEDPNTENTHAKELVNYIIQQVEHLDAKYSIIPVSSLRKAGWKFRDTELIGEPD